jgi:hypothetical protein
LAQRWATIMLTLALTVSLFVAPAYAHTTLGNLTGSPPFRFNDNELNPSNTVAGDHVPGPLGYVWPGSGLDAYSGDPSNPPGYQSPFTTYENPSQLAGNAYAPEGAILTSTVDHDNVGDLIFAINFSQPQAYLSQGGTPKTLPSQLGTSNPDFSYGTVAIYIPAPVFDATGALVQDGFQPAGGINWDNGENTNIVTSITDNYGSIFVTRADQNDPFEPGSWILYITAPNNVTFTAARHWDEWYYIRINQMRAPQVAGRYFFKMFLDDHYPVRSQGTPPNLISGTMPMENWPVLLVKGEVDPAIVWGTVRYGGIGNSALYGLPLDLPGRVRAIGVATDPVTGLSTGRAVEARGYFNATSQGHFEIEGVAPGIYDIYASAAGFPEQRIAENVKVLRGQSLELDGYLEVGPEIRGSIFSKEMYGLTPWPGQFPITVVIYDSNVYDAASIVTISPTNLTDAPYSSYVYGNTVFTGNQLTAANGPKRLVAFPWEGPIGYYGYTPGPGPSFKDQFGLFNGVGPAQSWWANPFDSLDPITQLGSTGDEFRFQFGSEPFYGAPAKFSGMVPQVFATWTDSLSPGVYYVRAFVNGYVQTSIDGTRFVDYPFQIRPSTSSQDVFIPIDLQKSAAFDVIVHFHDVPGTLASGPIGGPDPERFLIAEAFASDGTLAAFNFTQVNEASNQASIMLNGFGMAGSITLPPFDPRASMKYSLARYRGIYDYGLPTDTYTIRVFMRGYIQALPPATTFDELDQPITGTISMGSSVATLSTHMYRGGGINATLSSTDWETPPVQRNWLWSGASASALVYDIASKAFIDVIYFWNESAEQWMIPRQNSDFSSLPWPSWRSSFGAGASLLVTNGSTLVDRLGPDVPNFPTLDPSQDKATAVFLQENFHSGFLFSSSTYRTPTFRSSIAIYPGAYAVNVWTYGYVQDSVAAVGDLGNVRFSIPMLGAIADSNIKLMIGVNLTISIIFKTEGILSGIPANSSVRIRVFDNGDDLVAATTVFSDAGVLVPSSQAGFFANGVKLLSQPVPAGTQILEYVDLAGLFSYSEPSGGTARVSSAVLFSPDHGIWGLSTHPGSYSGEWTVMVDVVNWYLPNAFYPPAPALLQGESPFFYPYNHLGPYEQAGYARIPNAPQGGGASVEFELDQRGYVQGLVLGMDWDDATRTMSWVSLQINSGSTSYKWYTWDGWFDGYLDPGTYQVLVTEWTNRAESHQTQQLMLAVSEGQRGTQTIVLGETGMAIPELASPLPILAVTLTLALVGALLRKTPENRPKG